MLGIIGLYGNPLLLLIAACLLLIVVSTVRASDQRMLTGTPRSTATSARASISPELARVACRGHWGSFSSVARLLSPVHRSPGAQIRFGAKSDRGS